MFYRYSLSENSRRVPYSVFRAAGIIADTEIVRISYGDAAPGDLASIRRWNCSHFPSEALGLDTT